MPRLVRLVLVVFCLFGLITGLSACQEKNDLPYGTFTNMSNDERNGGLLQAGLKNFHLYGYKVLSGDSAIEDDDGYGYMEPDAVANKPILDSAKMNQSLYSSNEAYDSFSRIIQSTKIEEFYYNFNSTVDASYRGIAFSGDIHASFNVSKQTKSTQVFIRHTNYVSVYESFYTGSTNQLIPMLSDQFQSAVISYKETPSRLFDEYGTHLILQYYLGGRTDLNFTFNNTSSLSSEQINASVNMSYRAVSGEATAEEKKTAKSFMSNSIMTFHSYGGNPIIGTTPDEIAGQYSDWKDSVIDKPNISRISNFNQSLLPIWELIEDPSLKLIYQTEFNHLAEIRRNHLNNLKYVEVPLYITDIVVVYGGSASSASDKIPAGYEKVLLNPGTDDTTKLEANHNAGGDYIYIAYKYGTNKNDAVVEIKVLSGKDKTVSGFTKVNVDLNRGAGGDYIYLYYRRASTDEQNNPNTRYIQEIRGSYGQTKFSLPTGWYWLTDMVDLNKGAGGSYIYLAVRK